MLPLHMAIAVVFLIHIGFSLYPFFLFFLPFFSSHSPSALLSLSALPFFFSSLSPLPSPLPFSLLSFSLPPSLSLPPLSPHPSLLSPLFFLSPSPLSPLPLLSPLPSLSPSLPPFFPLSMLMKVGMGGG